ncbi:hypothetical protein HJFPF1_02607 [Paramyrothecium foliicola]|nr:hypothetical protein HJFPF1_02607 [Paramyrothecium foliicola]
MPTYDQNVDGPSYDPEYHPATGTPAAEDRDWLIVTQIGDVEEFFPRIRDRVADPNNKTPFKVSCPICMETVYDSENPHATPSRGKDIPMLTPCGHVFCKGCLEATSASFVSRKLPRTCPSCRHPLECTTCGQMVKVVPPPLFAEEKLWLETHWTQTIPEGGMQRPQCDRCQSHSLWQQRVGCSPIGVRSSRSSLDTPEEIQKELKDLVYQAAVKAARYCEAKHIETLRMEDIVKVIKTEALEPLVEAEIAAANDIRRTQRALGNYQWTGFGHNPRRKEFVYPSTDIQENVTRLV